MSSLRCCASCGTELPRGWKSACPECGKTGKVEQAAEEKVVDEANFVLAKPVKSAAEVYQQRTQNSEFREKLKRKKPKKDAIYHILNFFGMGEWDELPGFRWIAVGLFISFSMLLGPAFWWPTYARVFGIFGVCLCFFGYARAEYQLTWVNRRVVQGYHKAGTANYDDSFEMLPSVMTGKTLRFIAGLAFIPAGIASYYHLSGELKTEVFAMCKEKGTKEDVWEAIHQEHGRCYDLSLECGTDNRRHFVKEKYLELMKSAVPMRMSMNRGERELAAAKAKLNPKPVAALPTYKQQSTGTSPTPVVASIPSPVPTATPSVAKTVPRTPFEQAMQGIHTPTADNLEIKRALLALRNMPPEDGNRAKVHQELVALFQQNKDTYVRSLIPPVLTQWKTADTPLMMAQLFKLQTEWNLQIQTAIISEMCKTPDPRIAADLAAVIGYQASTQKVANALIQIGPAAEEAVIPILENKDVSLARNACMILRQIGTEKSLKPLRTLSHAEIRNFGELTAKAIEERVRETPDKKS